MDAELTPLGNVAFNGAVAEEINRLMRVIRNVVRVGDELCDWVQANMVCACTKTVLCNKCDLLNQWELVRRG